MPKLAHRVTMPRPDDYNIVTAYAGAIRKGHPAVPDSLREEVASLREEISRAKAGRTVTVITQGRPDAKV